MPAGVLTDADKFDAQMKERAMGEMEQVLDRNIGRQAEYARTHPMQIVAGEPGPSINGIARSVVIDKVLLEKSAPFRLKNEPLTAFYARTGVSAHAVRTLSREALANLIRVKAENADDLKDPSKYWRAPSVGSRTGAPLHVTFDASGDLDGFYSKGTQLPNNMIEVGI